MWLGAHAPGRLHRLVLANTAARMGPPDNWNARIEKVRAGGMGAISQAVLERWFTPGFMAKHPDRIAAMRQMMERTPAQGYIACCVAVRDMDQRDSVATITVPTLVISGTRDVATPPAEGKFLAERIQVATYAEFDAPHLSNIEAAPAFTAALLAFLNA